jgi:putative acyl-CoA dehydrogenase
MFDTHSVLNQSESFDGINPYAVDVALQEAVARAGIGDAQAAQLQQLGQKIAAAARKEWPRLANQFSPRLQNYNRQGQRVDEVEFHPAWHELMALMMAEGVHASPWQAQAGDVAQTQAAPTAQALRAAQYILFGQLENGAQCPVTMTYAAVPALRLAPAMAEKWLPKVFSREYDPASKPMEQKRGVLIGMGMTEKQGGSDVRSNTTRAELIDADDALGARYRLIGHKWFFSAPQADAHLVLAQTDPDSAKGLSCFFVPRYLPDGSRNKIIVQRLKDKLGNRSNASSEVEFQGAEGWLLGAIGRGVASIMEMGHHTRLDCVLGSAGIMRAALCHALHHARQRRAFGRLLAEQPLMQNVLADLALESEAATAFAMRLAQCYDWVADPQQALLARLLTPAGKYWLCKRGPTFGAEAMEVLGGNGYVEDGPLARLYREFPVNSIWEGSGNVMCLDLLRALAREPATRHALAQELQAAQGRAPVYDAYCARLMQDLAPAPDVGGRAGAGSGPDCLSEFCARSLAERIVLAVQGGLLLRHAPDFVAHAFVASRIAQPVSAAFGCLPGGVEAARILQRALLA